MAAAFAALTSAWPAEIPWAPETIEAMGRMKVLYPRLKDKPELPEAGRRFLVQAKAFIKAQAEPGPAGFTKALESYNMVLSIAPWYPAAYFNAALLRAQLKQYDGAILDMKAYLELSPGAPDARAAQDKIYEWPAQLNR